MIKNQGQLLLPCMLYRYNQHYTVTFFVYQQRILQERLFFH